MLRWRLVVVWVNRLCAAQPDSRFASIAVLVAALASHVRGEEVDRPVRSVSARPAADTALTAPPGDDRLNVRNLGINYPWVDDHAGTVQYLWMQDYRSRLVEDDLDAIASLGVRIIRVFAPVEAVMSYGGTGFTLVEAHAANVDRLLESAARREMQVILVMGDGNGYRKPEDHDGKFRWELIKSDSGRRIVAAACAAYVLRFRRHNNVLMWEVANEPYANLTWAPYPQQLKVTLDEAHAYLRAAYQTIKPLTTVHVGFSDLHEEGQQKYRLYTNQEFRQRYIDDATDVYSIHIYRDSPRDVPDFAGLGDKPKWCTEVGSYNYVDETGAQHLGQPGHGELWDEQKNFQAVTAIVPRLLDGGIGLVLPWAFTENEGMVVHRPDGSHELKSLPRWMREQLQER
jgi:hypothetical protein